MPRMIQTYCVGGNYNKPSSFSAAINRNIKILKDSDRNCKIIDVKINIIDDPRYSAHGLTYLAYILAEVDITTEEMYIGYTPPSTSRKKGRKKNKKR